VTTEDTESTVLTEGGTKQRKRYRRQATPPGNETVFIAEKVTPMISLVGRDTESRVGRRSTTEMRMREVDWKQVKQKQDDLMREAAIAKGNRKTNNVDVIMGIVQTPSFDVKPTPVSGDEGEGEGEGGSDDDESELARRVKMRNDIHGPSQRGTIHIVNGEHRMDETEMQGRDAAAEIDAQVGDFEPPDVDEIKKLRKFNVQTFINWKRRDPQERIYQSARWNDEETEKFYEALRCCGVDFGSMAEWFPHRIRRSLKRKFNIEERVNPERINETLDAHMMMVAHGDGGDDGTGWDLSQFHANGAGYDLRDPREVEKELEKIRAERQVEIEEARKEFEAERRNQKLAGVEHSDEEEEEEYEEIEVEVEEGEEEEGGVERVGDMITRVQKEQAEKKQKEREAAAGAVADASAEAGAEQDGNADDDDNDEDEDDDDEPANEGEVQLLEDYEEQYASGADWDDE
jgi:transcription factor TFIIIB component B''